MSDTHAPSANAGEDPSSEQSGADRERDLHRLVASWRERFEAAIELLEADLTAERQLRDAQKLLLDYERERCADLERMVDAHDSNDAHVARLEYERKQNANLMRVVQALDVELRRQIELSRELARTPANRAFRFRVRVLGRRVILTSRRRRRVLSQFLSGVVNRPRGARPEQTAAAAGAPAPNRPAPTQAGVSSSTTSGKLVDARATIVIPVHNGAAMTKQCLDTLLAQETDAEIVVVDDSSSDETGLLLETYGERLHVLRNPTNLGFGRSCNRGAAAATTEYLVLLNNDTIPHPGWLDALLHHAELHPTAAVVGCKLLYPDGTIQHAGMTFTQAGQPYHLYKGFPGDHPAVNHPRRLQAVTGACVLIRRDVFEKLGGFDESYLNSHEDIDLCMRAALLGYEVHYCPAATVTHLESATRDLVGPSEYEAQRRWLAQWGASVRRDNLELMMEDGLITVEILPSLRASISVDPMVGSTVSADTLAFEQAIERATDRWLAALDRLDDPAAPGMPGRNVAPGD